MYFIFHLNILVRATNNLFSASSKLQSRKILKNFAFLFSLKKVESFLILQILLFFIDEKRILFNVIFISKIIVKRTVIL